LSGYGYEYTFDSSQPRAVWWRGDESAYLRLRRSFARADSTSLLRWRRSTVDDASTFLEGFDGSFAGVPQRLVDFSRWRADNSSWAAAQDFTMRPAGDDLLLLGGGSIERKNLQKAYATAF